MSREIRGNRFFRPARQPRTKLYAKGEIRARPDRVLWVNSWATLIGTARDRPQNGVMGDVGALSLAASGPGETESPYVVTLAEIVEVALPFADRLHMDFPASPFGRFRERRKRVCNSL